jgi:hypothetical protein
MQGKLPLTTLERQKLPMTEVTASAKVHALRRRCRMLNKNDKLHDVTKSDRQIRSGRLEGEPKLFAACTPKPELNNLAGASDI